jgi:hypothetical protein
LHRRYSFLSEIEEAIKLTRKKREAHEKLKFTSQSRPDKLEKSKSEWEEAESHEKTLKDGSKATQSLVIEELNDCETYRIEAYRDWIHDFVGHSLDFERRTLKVLGNHDQIE